MLSLDNKRVEELIASSRTNPRKRVMHAVHPADHKGPRVMLNAIQPESYARPHMHPSIGEIFTIERGKICVITFDDAGGIDKSVVLSKDSTLLVDVPPRTYHTAFAIEKDSAMYETSQGPYVPETYKTFADWAPKEEDTEAARAYLSNLKNLALSS